MSRFWLGLGVVALVLSGGLAWAAEPDARILELMVKQLRDTISELQQEVLDLRQENRRLTFVVKTDADVRKQNAKLREENERLKATDAAGKLLKENERLRRDNQLLMELLARTLRQSPESKDAGKGDKDGKPPGKPSKGTDPPPADVKPALPKSAPETAPAPGVPK